MSTDQLIVDLTNYADHQAVLLKSIASARIASSETDMELQRNYYRELSYNMVPRWVKNGGILDADEDYIIETKAASSSPPVATDNTPNDDETVQFPAITTMKFFGNNDESSATNGEGTWQFSVRNTSATAQATTSTEGLKSDKKQSLTSRRREELLKRQDPCYWFAASPPKLLQQTQLAWREVVKAAIELARSKGAVMHELSQLEKSDGA